MKEEMEDRKESMLKAELKTTTSATRLQDREENTEFQTADSFLHEQTVNQRLTLMFVAAVH